MSQIFQNGETGFLVSPLKRFSLKRIFPKYIQTESKDCGPSCLLIVSQYYGRKTPIQYLRQISETTREGTSLVMLQSTAEKVGYRTMVGTISFKELQEIDLFPLILPFNKNHYVVLYKITKNYVYLSDPARGKIKMKHSDFKKKWNQATQYNGEHKGLVLLLEPTKEFEEKIFPKEENIKKKIIQFVFSHLKTNGWPFIGLGFLVIFSLIITILLPMLIQVIVDQAIPRSSLSLLSLIGVASLVLRYKSKRIN